MAIQLNPAEQVLRADLKKIYDTICARTGVHSTAPGVSDQQNNADHSLMEDLGRSLRQSLVKRNVVPVHDATLIKNRGMQPHQKGFYEHLHSVESLLNQT